MLLYLLCFESVCCEFPPNNENLRQDIAHCALISIRAINMYPIYLCVPYNSAMTNKIAERCAVALVVRTPLCMCGTGFNTNNTKVKITKYQRRIIALHVIMISTANDFMVSLFFISRVLILPPPSLSLSLYLSFPLSHPYHALLLLSLLPPFQAPCSGWYNEQSN